MWKIDKIDDRWNWNYEKVAQKTWGRLEKTNQGKGTEREVFWGGFCDKWEEEGELEEKLPVKVQVNKRIEEVALWM
jgi:hypothetical protein